jgi:hypothetical protein
MKLAQKNAGHVTDLMKCRTLFALFSCLIAVGGEIGDESCFSKFTGLDIPPPFMQLPSDRNHVLGRILEISFSYPTSSGKHALPSGIAAALLINRRYDLSSLQNPTNHR